jgi:hypothetical protein
MKKIPMGCKKCGQKAISVERIDGFEVPLCLRHGFEHYQNGLKKELDKLIRDMLDGKPYKCSPIMEKLAKQAVEKIEHARHLDRGRS